MKFMRWLAFSLFLLLGIPLLGEFSGVIVSSASYAKHSLWYSIVGLGPMFLSHLAAAVVGVLVGGALAPSKKKVAGGVSAIVAVLFSMLHASYWVFHLTAASGALVGAALTMVYIYKRWPNQALEPTSTAVTPPADAGDRASGTRGSS